MHNFLIGTITLIQVRLLVQIELTVEQIELTLLVIATRCLVQEATIQIEDFIDHRSVQT